MRIMSEFFDAPEDDNFASAGLRLTIDLTALTENWRDMARRSGAARASAVVKADAYGMASRIPAKRSIWQARATSSSRPSTRA